MNLNAANLNTALHLNKEKESYASKNQIRTTRQI